MSYEGPVIFSPELERILGLRRRVVDFESPEVDNLRRQWSRMLLNEAGQAIYDRIVALPTEGEREEAFARIAKKRDKGGENCPILMSGEQAVALYEAFHEQGAFISAGVGFGKTLVSLLLSLIFGAPRPVLFVTGGLRDKTHDDFRDLTRYWKAPRPLPEVISFEMLGSPKGDMLLCDCARCLRAANEPATPGGLRPTHVFADESDKFRDPKTATTRRMSRYMAKHPTTVYVGMTGTAWRTSIKNAAPQLVWALKLKAPVPLDFTTMQTWSEALDLSTREIRRDPGALCWLEGRDPNQIATYQERVDVAAEGFKRRLLETPGVIQTKGQSCKQPIFVRMLKAPEDPVLDAAFHYFRSKGTTLDGWDVSDQLSKLRHGTEMGTGFYYVWWNERAFKKQVEVSRPAIQALGLRDCVKTEGNGLGIASAVSILRNEQNSLAWFHGIPPLSHVPLSREAVAYAIAAVCGTTPVLRPAELEPYCAGPISYLSICWAVVFRAFPVLFGIFAAAVDAARPPKEWLDARREASTFVREKIAESARRGKPLDSSAPVYAAYPDEPVLVRWKELEKTFEPTTVANPITASVLGYAAQWVKVNGPGLIWVQHDYVGHALSGMLGIPFFASKGKDSTGRYVEKYSAANSAILSLTANERGRNLQSWNRALIIGPHPAGTKWEQGLFGRMHRQGQENPVFVDVLLSCAEDVRAVEKAYAEAGWGNKNVGTEQKFLIAAFDWSHFPAQELEDLPLDHPARARWARN